VGVPSERQSQAGNQQRIPWKPLTQATKPEDRGLVIREASSRQSLRRHPGYRTVVIVDDGVIVRKEPRIPSSCALHSQERAERSLWHRGVEGSNMTSAPRSINWASMTTSHRYARRKTGAGLSTFSKARSGSITPRCMRRPREAEKPPRGLIRAVRSGLITTGTSTRWAPSTRSDEPLDYHAFASKSQTNRHGGF